MPATTNSDKFLNTVPRWSGQVGAAGVSSTTATVIPLQSTTGLVNGRAYFFTFNRLTGTTKNPVSSTEGLVGVVNTSTNEITTTLANRGLEGAAAAWAAGTLVEILHSAGYMNRFIEGLEVSLNQDGTLKSTALDGTKVYAADAGSTDDYAITLAPAPSAYATGQTFRFKANTANTGAASLNVNSLGAKTIKKNYNSDLATGDILANQLVEVIYDGTNFQMLSPVAAGTGIMTTDKYASRGFLLNGKIVPSVASNNLTVAIKGMDGNDPSASNPVYCRIGDTVRTITSALSVTKNAGTNWFNAGSAGLATKEIDYFVYLGYNATDGVVIGFARIPYPNEYDDFSATSTNEKYCAISTVTNAAAGDDYENVGRFAATLSAGAGYTWSVPTFTNKNLIQRPIYETRRLSYTVNPTGYSTPATISGIYKIMMTDCFVNYSFGGGTVGVSNATTLTYPLPISALPRLGEYISVCGRNYNNSSEGTGGQANIAYSGSAVGSVTLFNGVAGATWTASNGKFWEGQMIYPINNT